MSGAFEAVAFLLNSIWGAVLGLVANWSSDASVADGRKYTVGRLRYDCSPVGTVLGPRVAWLRRPTGTQRACHRSAFLPARSGEL